MSFRVNLDEMEQQSGIYSDNHGELHVLTPMIQGELILHKTYYNYKNQDVLVRELEQRFNVSFQKFDVELEDLDVEAGNKDERKINEIGLSNPSSNEVVRDLIEDKNVYDRLKAEYTRYGKKAKQGWIGFVNG